jgi:hypothetical protein
MRRRTTYRWQLSRALIDLFFNERASGPSTVVRQAQAYLARNFSMIGDRNEPRGFLVSPRPVSRRAICRSILVVRWPAAISAIIWPLLAAVPNIRESNGIAAIGELSIALANSRTSISGRFGMPT